MKAAWNTGRLYGREGQRIAAMVSADGKQILFADDDRMVDGAFPIARVPQDAYAMRALVMAAYDHNNYGYVSHEQVRELYRAAREHAPRLAHASGQIVTWEGA